jgi:hypothetical protein
MLLGTQKQLAARGSTIYVASLAALRAAGSAADPEIMEIAQRVILLALPLPWSNK